MLEINLCNTTAQLRLNQTRKAIESFKQVVKLDPKNIDARYNMAVAYLTLGNKMAARIQVHVLKDIDSELANELEELIDRYVIPIRERLLNGKPESAAA